MRYRFHCVKTTLLQLFNITGIDACPFQLLQRKWTCRLWFSGKDDVRTLSIISSLLRCSCMEREKKVNLEKKYWQRVWRIWGTAMCVEERKKRMDVFCTRITGVGIPLWESNLQHSWARIEAMKQIDSILEWTQGDTSCRREGSCFLKEGEFHSHSLSFLLQNALLSSSWIVWRVYPRCEELAEWIRLQKVWIEHCVVRSERKNSMGKEERESRWKSDAFLLDKMTQSKEVDRQEMVCTSILGYCWERVATSISFGE